MADGTSFPDCASQILRQEFQSRRMSSSFPLWWNGKVAPGLLSSSNLRLGAVTPSGCHNFKIVQAVSRKGQCLCGRPANTVNSNLSWSKCPGQSKVMEYPGGPVKKQSVAGSGLYPPGSRPRMAVHLESLDNAHFLAGKVGDVLMGVLFNTQSYARGLKLVENLLLGILGEMVREKDNRIIESRWVWSLGLGISSLFSYGMLVDFLFEPLFCDLEK